MTRQIERYSEPPIDIKKILSEATKLIDQLNSISSTDGDSRYTPLQNLADAFFRFQALSPEQKTDAEEKTLAIKLEEAQLAVDPPKKSVAPVAEAPQPRERKPKQPHRFDQALNDLETLASEVVQEAGKKIPDALFTEITTLRTSDLLRDAKLTRTNEKRRATRAGKELEDKIGTIKEKLEALRHADSEGADATSAGEPKTEIPAGDWEAELDKSGTVSPQETPKQPRIVGRLRPRTAPVSESPRPDKEVAVSTTRNTPEIPAAAPIEISPREALTATVLELLNIRGITSPTEADLETILNYLENNPTAERNIIVNRAAKAIRERRPLTEKLLSQQASAEATTALNMADIQAAVSVPRTTTTPRKQTFLSGIKAAAFSLLSVFGIGKAVDTIQGTAEDTKPGIAKNVSDEVQIQNQQLLQQILDQRTNQANQQEQAAREQRKKDERQIQEQQLFQQTLNEKTNKINQQKQADIEEAGREAMTKRFDTNSRGPLQKKIGTEAASMTGSMGGVTQEAQNSAKEDVFSPAQNSSEENLSTPRQIDARDANAMSMPEEITPKTDAPEITKKSTIEKTYTLKTGDGILNAFAFLLSNGGREKVTKALLAQNPDADPKKILSEWENEQLKNNGVNPKTNAYTRGTQVFAGDTYALAFTPEGPVITLEQAVEGSEAELKAVEKTRIVKANDTFIGILKEFLADNTIAEQVVNHARENGGKAMEKLNDDQIQKNWLRKQLESNGVVIDKYGINFKKGKTFLPGSVVELKTDKTGNLGVYVMHNEKPESYEQKTEQPEESVAPNEVLFGGQTYEAGQTVWYKTQRGVWKEYEVVIEYKPTDVIAGIQRRAAPEGSIQLKAKESPRRVFAISSKQAKNLVTEKPPETE